MIKADKFESKSITYWVNYSLKKNPPMGYALDDTYPNILKPYPRRSARG